MITSEENSLALVAAKDESAREDASTTAGAVAVLPRVSGKKRPLGDVTSDVIETVAKRPKLAVMAATDDCVGKFDEKLGVTRTSNLKAPTMQLSGHSAAVSCCVFSTDGAQLATGGEDKCVLLWHVYGDCQNHTQLTGHRGPILQVAWGPSPDTLLTAAADGTAAQWDVEYGLRTRQFKAHSAVVNSVCTTLRGSMFVATGSDDGSSCLFDPRMKKALKRIDAKYQVTAVCLDHFGTQLYTGGIDNVIKVWDLRKGTAKPSMFLGISDGHLDTVTSLALNSDQSMLLSNAMDCTLRVWNVAPFVANSDTRLMKTMTGALHGTEKRLLRAHWSADSRRVVAGSSDKCSYVFEVDSGDCVYKLPGHKGSCNEVDYHPLEPIIVSCSSDQTLFLGEL